MYTASLLHRKTQELLQSNLQSTAGGRQDPLLPRLLPTFLDCLLSLALTTLGSFGIPIAVVVDGWGDKICKLTAGRPSYRRAKGRFGRIFLCRFLRIEKQRNVSTGSLASHGQRYAYCNGQC